MVRRTLRKINFKITTSATWIHLVSLRCEIINIMRYRNSKLWRCHCSGKAKYMKGWIGSVFVKCTSCSVETDYYKNYWDGRGYARAYRDWQMFNVHYEENELEAKNDTQRSP